LVTLVFTDIEGSTRRLEELGAGAYQEAIEWQNCPDVT
jgi:class 3 adenylate cyclase